MNTIHKRIAVVVIVVFVLVVSIILCHIIFSVTLDKSIEYKKIPYHSERISGNLDGYTIAFITDTHSMTVEDLEKVVQELNKRQLNLLLLGGDFAFSKEATQRSMETLSKVVTTNGIYGVEGNHDKYQDLFAAMEQYGIHPLSNSGVGLEDGFYLAGVEDLWNRQPDIAKAVKDALPDDFVLLVAHNPDVTMEQDTSSVDLILSGHTHGGQVTLFGIWAPELTLRKTITKYGQRFMSGWAKSKDSVPVFVSRGTGYLSNVPRVFARPQVIIFTLMSEEEL